MKTDVKQLHNDPYDRLTAQNQVYAEGNRRRDNIHNMIAAGAEALKRIADDNTRLAEITTLMSEAFDSCARLTDIDYSSANKDDVLHGIDVLISELQAIVIRERLR